MSDRLPEKNFMRLLGLGHFHHFTSAVVHFQFLRQLRRRDVLLHVAAFQSARKVHREKPARDVTGQAQDTSECPQKSFPQPARRGAELGEPSADMRAMRPLFRLDSFDMFFFRRFAQRSPMPAIRVSRRQLAGVSVLQDNNQVLPRAFVHR